MISVARIKCVSHFIICLNLFIFLLCFSVVDFSWNFLHRLNRQLRWRVPPWHKIRWRQMRAHPNRPFDFNANNNDCICILALITNGWACVCSAIEKLFLAFIHVSYIFVGNSSSSLTLSVLSPSFFCCVCSTIKCVAVMPSSSLLECRQLLCILYILRFGLGCECE